MPTIVLIDLSSVLHPIWHMSQGDPDPNHTSVQTVAKVRALASGQPHVAVCCDSGRSFRHEIDPTYKANRPAADATLHHQMALAKETLVTDGFPVWTHRGFEADDLIATATRLAVEMGSEVLVVSSDKDLLQLVGPRVQAKSLTTGAVLDEQAVREKFGVEPGQVRDYLSLVGDASDNVKGAKGIGPKKAAALLVKHKTIDNLYANLKEIGPADLDIKPSEAASLSEFESRYPTVRSLIALRDDVPLAFSEVLGERIPKDAEKFGMEEDNMSPTETAEEPSFVDLVKGPGPVPAAPDPEPSPTVPAPVALAVREEPPVIDAVPIEWERQLDPRSMRDAKELAQYVHASRLFSAYGTAQGVLTTVMVGRELGLPAMASLRSIHIVEGRHSLSSSLMVALILRSGLAEFFRPVTDDKGVLACDDKSATFETLRKGPGNRLVRYTFTIEEAKLAGLVKEKSGWAKSPKAMLIARAETGLARLVYPDLMAGLYTPEEIEAGRGSEAAA